MSRCKYCNDDLGRWGGRKCEECKQVLDQYFFYGDKVKIRWGFHRDREGIVIKKSPSAHFGTWYTVLFGDDRTESLKDILIKKI